MKASGKYNAKRDANESEIFAEAKAIGCEVIQHSEYDAEILTPERHINLMIEIKTPTGRLTPKQRGYIDKGWPLYVVRSKHELRALVIAADNGEL